MQEKRNRNNRSGTESPLKGAIFGLYTAEDIKFKEGKTLIEKDTLIELKTTDVNGEIAFIADLPDTPKKETPAMPKTGDDRSPLIWLLLLGLGGGMAGAAWFLRKKGKEDQNQD